MLDTLEQLLEGEPFEPFRITLTSGDRYYVLNPHLVAIGASKIFCYYPRSDRFAFLRMNQIAAMESITQGKT